MSESVGHRGARNRRTTRVWVLLLAVACVMVGFAAGWPVRGETAAASMSSLTVTADADPPSGSGVHPGDSVTYLLTATGADPVPTGALVVDDVSDLLDDATVTSTASELADAGLRLDEGAGTISWTVPPVGEPGSAGAEAHASFRVRVADTAPAGSVLVTTAALTADTCAAGDPCATALVVTAPDGPDLLAAAETSTPADPPVAADVAASPADRTAESTDDTSPAAVTTPAEGGVASTPGSVPSPGTPQTMDNETSAETGTPGDAGVPPVTEPSAPPAGDRSVGRSWAGRAEYRSDPGT